MASTVWKGHLTFGLVSLPVKLYSAARSESVSFNQLHSDPRAVREVADLAFQDDDSAANSSRQHHGAYSRKQANRDT